MPPVFTQHPILQNLDQAELFDRHWQHGQFNELFELILNFNWICLPMRKFYDAKSGQDQSSLASRFFAFGQEPDFCGSRAKPALSYHRIQVWVL